jgi:formylglycine-generating enzyme required for sulfatase activity/serine/threonine protein kinase
MPTLACPSRTQLDAFQCGNLDEALFAEVGSHLEECPTCQRAMETLIGDSADSVLKALLDEPQSDSFAAEAACRQAVERAAALAGESTSAPGASEGTLASAAERDGAVASESLPVASIREYKLLAKLGEGGMGAVYKALHTRLDKVVALKVLPAERMRDAGAVARFQREMKAVGRLDHPNIVRAMDAGEEGGMHFLVMEYVEGIDLSQLAKSIGPLPAADACELVRQAALGLAEAHEHGMVHRDIKPSNLILAKSKKKKGQPTVKILDLGLALLSEALSPDHQGLTSTGQMMGTIDYMAPEQGGDSHQVDIRADIYSLGATLYRLLAGSAPFGSEKFDTPVKKLTALATQSPASVMSRRPDIPAPLAAIVDRMLDKNPAARFSTPEELADVLAPFCQGADLAALLARASAPIAAPPISASEAGTHARSSPSGDTAPTLDRAAIPPKARSVVAGATKIPRLVAVAAACAGAALAVLLGVIFYIQTQRGTIQIEINDPSIKVVLDNDSTATFSGVDKKHQIKVKPGEHGLTITRGGFSFNTDKFVLKKGETIRLSVEYRPGIVQVVTSDGRSLGAQSLDQEVAALEFDGKGRVEFPRLILNPAQPLTIESWTIPRKSVSTALVAGFAGQLAIRLERDRWWFRLREAGGGVREVGSAEPVAWNRPVHLAGVWDGSEIRLFVNGEPQGSPLKCRPAAAENWMATLAASSSGSDAYVGQFTQLRFSKSARYQDSFAPPAEFSHDVETLALYRFDEGAGTKLKDTSGNNHHGKIEGAQWVKVTPPSDPTTSGLHFAASGDKVSPINLEYASKESFTIEARLKFSGPGTAPIAGLYGSENWFVLHRFGMAVEFCVHGPTGTQRVTHKLAENSNDDVHLAGVWDGSVPKLYVNGKLAPDPVKLEELRVQRSTPCLLIGGDQVNANLQAIVDEVRITSRARYSQEFTPEDRFSADADTLALYHFDEGTGTELKDSSGNNHHGKIVGAKWVQGDLPRSSEAGLEFRGKAYVKIPTLLHRPVDPITIEAVVTRYPKPGATGPIVSSISRASGQYSHGVILLYSRRHPDELWTFLISNTDRPEDTITLKSSKAEPRLTRVAGVWDGRVARLFVEGKKVAEEPIAQAFETPSGPFPFYIGADGEGDNWRNPFYGVIHEVRISKTARYAADYLPVNRLESDAGTLALYHFDEGEGNVLTDSSGNNHHGKIVGAKWVSADANDVPATEFTNALGMKFALVPKGKSWLGGGGGKLGEREVEFQDDFFIGVYPVTQEEWEKITGANAAHYSRNGFRKEAVKDISDADLKRFPVEGVSYTDVQAFLAQLNERENEADWVYRLPTSDEWEYACRGGPIDRAASAFHFYVPEPTNELPSDRANYAHAGGPHRTVKVGQYPPNKLGIYDMHGNVLEWCSDAGVDPKWGDFHVARGSSWNDPRFGAAQVLQFSPGVRYPSLGLRVIRARRIASAALPVTDSSGNNHHGKILGAKWVRAEESAKAGFTNSLDMKFVHIPKGESWLGGGGGTPGTHHVVLADDFYLGTHEVTQAQWLAVTGLNPSQFRGLEGLSDEEALRLPVEKVSWEDAQLFLDRLNARDKQPGWVYRLPTEAEWEYACRGGPRSDMLDCGFHYYFDKPSNDLLPAQANFSNPEAVNRTNLVGSQGPNPLGLFDMHGNVWEWCQDEAPPDPAAASTEPHRAMRGGSWNSSAESCQAAHSLGRPASFRGMHVGLRVARVRTSAAAEPSPPGFALRFDEASKEPDLSAVQLPTKGPWTVEGWFTPRDPLPGRNEAALIFMVDPCWMSVRDSSQGMKWALGGPVFSPPPTLYSDDKVVVGQATHVALTREPEGVVFFINGEKQANPLPVALSGDDKPLRLCLKGDPKARDVPYQGDVDEVRVSSIIRYRENFTPKPRFEPDADTLALFHFDEGQGDELTDSSGNNRHGKIQGANWVQWGGEVAASGVAKPPTEAVTAGNANHPVPLLQPLKGFAGHQGNVSAVCFSEDGRSALSGGFDKSVRYWNSATGQQLSELKGHTDLIYGAALNKDKSLALSSARDGTVRLWDVATGGEVHRFTEKGWLFTVAFSPDGRLAAHPAESNCVRTWDVAKRQPLQLLKGHTDKIYHFAFSHNGKRIATASNDKTVRLWEVESGRSLKTLTGHTDRVRGVAFSRDDALLASCAGSAEDGLDTTIRIWDSETGAELQRLAGHATGSLSLAFSSSGRYLASGGYDGKLRLWDLKERRQVQEVALTDKGWVQGIAFSPDGTRLLTGSTAGLRLWSFDEGSPQ